MSYDFQSNADDSDNDDAAPALNIGERIEKGITTGSHQDGGILPFPSGLRGDAIIRALRGGERTTVERWQWAGYRPTYYEYRSASGELIQVITRQCSVNSCIGISQVGILRTSPRPKL